MKRRDFWRQICSNYVKNNFLFWQTYSRSHWTFLAARKMSTKVARALRYNLVAFLELRKGTTAQAFPTGFLRLSPAFLVNFSRIIAIMVDCFAEHCVVRDICPRGLPHERCSSKILERARERYWNLVYFVGAAQNIPVLRQLACSRLSVSEDDRKSERVTSGISGERDPGETPLVARPLVQSSTSGKEPGTGYETTKLNDVDFFKVTMTIFHRN